MGRSRGFGFVEMDEAGASAALSALDQVEFDGRTITVREQQQR
jgi:RNA recognition motif-containing protein